MGFLSAISPFYDPNTGKTRGLRSKSQTKTWRELKRESLEGYIPQEKAARRILSYLRTNCPALLFDDDGGPCAWHRSNCKKKGVGEPCTCVWRGESECKLAKWPELEELSEEFRELEMHGMGMIDRAIRDDQK